MLLSFKVNSNAGYDFTKYSLVPNVTHVWAIGTCGLISPYEKSMRRMWQLVKS